MSYRVKTKQDTFDWPVLVWSERSVYFQAPGIWLVLRII